MKERSSIILEAASGRSNTEIARNLEINRNTVKKWRSRYAQAAAEIIQREKNHPRELRGLIDSVLQDEYRPGAPATYPNEVVAQIISMSLQSPSEYGVEGSHWTPSELARQANKNNITENISARSVSRFLKMGQFKT